MRLSRIIHIILLCALVCACNREQSALSEYRDFAKELKENSSDYSEEDWQRTAKTYEKLEQKVEKCEFSAKQKKELNRLRGQCAAYFMKSITRQAKYQMQDAMEQFSDMAEGFNEALGDDDIEDLLNFEDE